MTDISAILVCQDATSEQAARSLAAAAAQARRHGLTVESVDVTAAGETQASARNAAAARATGTYLAFLDPLDLCCEDWLCAAHTAASATPGRIVWHPEAVLHYAGASPAWALQPDVESRDGDWVTLAVQNHWTASSFAARDIHVRTPYPDIDWADAAWTWNAAIIAAGCRHKPVNGTAHLTGHPVRAPGGTPQAATLWRDRIGWAHRVGLLGRAA